MLVINSKKSLKQGSFSLDPDKVYQRQVAMERARMNLQDRVKVDAEKRRVEQERVNEYFCCNTMAELIRCYYGVKNNGSEKNNMESSI